MIEGRSRIPCAVLAGAAAVLLLSGWEWRSAVVFDNPSSARCRSVTRDAGVAGPVAFGRTLGMNGEVIPNVAIELWDGTGVADGEGYVLFHDVVEKTGHSAADGRFFVPMPPPGMGVAGLLFTKSGFKSVWADSLRSGVYCMEVFLVPAGFDLGAPRSDAGRTRGDGGAN